VPRKLSCVICGSYAAPRVWLDRASVGAVGEQPSITSAEWSSEQTRHNVFNEQPPFLNNGVSFVGYDPESADLLGRRVSSKMVSRAPGASDPLVSSSHRIRHLCDAFAGQLLAAVIDQIRDELQLHGRRVAQCSGHRPG
jgi:hypothetical protein